MIQISFKGKRKGGEEWLEGDLNHIDGRVYIFDRHKDTAYEYNSPDFFEVEPETVRMVQGCENCKKKEFCTQWLRTEYGSLGERLTYCDKWETRL